MWHARLAQHYRHSTGVVAFGRFVQGCSSRSEAHAAGQDLTTLLGLKYMHVCIRCAPSCEVRFAPVTVWHACDRPEAAASTGSGSRASPASRLCSSSTCGGQTSRLRVGRGSDASIRQEVGSWATYFSFLSLRRFRLPMFLLFSPRFRWGGSCCGGRSVFASAGLQLGSGPARVSMPVGLGTRSCLPLSLSSTLTMEYPVG